MHMPYLPKRMYKTPGAILGYEFDWRRWLLRRGDTIASFEITVAEPGLTLSQLSSALGIVYVTIAGGVARSKYTVICKVVTNGLGVAGVLTNTRSMILLIENM